MRILELHAAELDLELHPRLTVVRDSDVARRREFADLLAGISRGVVPQHVTGLGEAHGILFGLTAGSVAALGLSSDAEVVLRPEDLPGAEGGSGPLAAEDAARAALSRLESDRSALIEALDDAREARSGVAEAAAAARQRLDDVVGNLERVQREHDERMQRASDAAEAAELAAAERVARREVLAARRSALEAEHRDAVDAARERVRRAREDVAVAGSSGEQLKLSPEDVAELDAVHAEVEEAEDRVERSRIPNPLAQRRRRAAEEREKVVLDRLGLPSYGAYLIRSSTMHVGPQAARLLQARAELSEAEEVLEEVEREQRPELLEVLHEEELLRALESGGEAEGVALDEVSVTRRAVEDAERSNAAAADGEAAAHARVADLEARLHAVESDIEGARAALDELAAPPPRPPEDAPEDTRRAQMDPEQIELFVLARLAGLRGVSSAGSSPAILDDAFAEVPGHALARLLALLDRISDAVQTIYLTGSPEVAAWGDSLGHDRCLVLGSSDPGGNEPGASVD